MEKKTKPDIYNCHTHIFTIDHVPNKFSKSIVPWFLPSIFTIKFIKWLYLNFTEKGSEKTKKKRFKRFLHKKRKFYYRFEKIARFTQIFWILYKIIVFVIKWFEKIILSILQLDFIISPKVKTLAERFLTLARYSVRYKNQASLFSFLKKNYPQGTKFVTLSMDMEYMGAGKPKVSYMNQLKELVKVKENHPEMCPFIAVDPRRIDATKGNKGKTDFSSFAKSYLHKGIFTGIKLYPALGYYPFDKELIDMYLFAQEHQIPIMTHTARGPVYYRGKKKKEWKTHPILEYTKKINERLPIPLPQSKNNDFTTNFTHPLNYHCLLNKTILSKYLGREVDLSKLKICFAHFGGDDEWRKYSKDVWNNYNNNIAPFSKDDYLKRRNTLNHGSTRTIWWNASWLSVIYDLMVNYENVYADVSATLYHQDLYPLLKYLSDDDKVKNKILFGTDYYVISKNETDKTLYQNLRTYLGKTHFDRIAVTNPKNYLRTV